MFSDRHRSLKLLSLGMILLAMCVQSYREGLRHAQSISSLSRDSRALAGATVEIAFVKVIGLLGEDRILASSRGKEFVLRTRQGPIRLGERISVTGRLCEGGVVEAETIVIHRYRWAKKLVSALAAVIVCLLVVSCYRICLERRSIVDRDSCRT